MYEPPKQYNPQETEDKIYKFWQERNLFSAKSNPSKKPFCIVIPPPNVTGILHMGHALNNTIQDILIRYHRMKGEESLWMPGTDHAGIATQNVVEKALAKEGLRRQDLGREKFLERVWQWKEQYGSTIINQLKKLGSSCDWPRSRFTMDEEYSKAVRGAFVRLWNKNLIYQDDKVINWCPRCQTALSDEEAPYQELQGSLYYLKYPLKDNPNEFITVATTRPETMLGDTAVAVNPKDKRYKKFIGKTLILPLINREIKIIADSMVDMKFGTGAVKVTPAHDPNDYILGKKHSLEFVNIMHPDGRLNKFAGDYKDMDRFQAREAILKDLKEKGLFEKAGFHSLSAGHCYRCHTIIEPRLSRQWFVKMGLLAKPAIEAVKKGKIKFYPKRWTKVYLNWMQDIQDWCISRQIWWGHQIPLWYCLDCKKEAFASAENPKTCRACNSQNLKQDEDVLDTWFSSWLWPFAIFGWPKDSADLKYFYPTSVLVTAPEIIFFWVARMIMAGFEFMGDIPFRDCYIHGTVRDIEGKKMSKSLGNIIDPLEIINKFGADALRFSIISITAAGQDVFLSEDKFQMGRNFANKIWNASRFVLSNLERDKIKVDLCIYTKENLTDLKDRWILSRFYHSLDKVTKAIEKYEINTAAKTIYEFFWHDFCDWYVELAKPDLLLSGKQKETTQIILYKVLEKSLRLLHPFMPFVTEEIWQKLNSSGESIMVSSWPHMQKQFISKNVEEYFKIFIDLISAIRNIRSQWRIDPFRKIDCFLKISHSPTKKLIEENVAYIKNLGKIENLKIGTQIKPPEKSAAGIIGKIEFYIPLADLIDVEKEKERIKKETVQLENILKGLSVRLKNKEFLKNAPKELVKNEKQKKLDLSQRLSKLKEFIKKL